MFLVVSKEVLGLQCCFVTEISYECTRNHKALHRDFCIVNYMRIYQYVYNGKKDQCFVENCTNHDGDLLCKKKIEIFS